MTRSKIDVLIAGGGFAGLTLAIALRQGLGPSFSVTVADPALGASQRRRRARLGHCRGGAASVRDHRRLAGRRGRGAADPRHGRHRQPARRRGAADLSHFRGRGRAGRAVRPHDREPAAGRCAGGEGAGSRRHTAARRRHRRSHRDGRPHDRRTHRRRRISTPDFWSPPMARGRPFAPRAGIATHGWSYGQSAIVTNVAHERDHRGTRRGAFPARRAVRDPAAQRPPLVDRVDRNDSARRRASWRCPTMRSMPSWSSASSCSSARSA